MSTPWFSKPLGDGVWAYSQTDQVKDLFEPLFVLAGQPVDMAVFTRHESEGRLHCEVIAYFSPAAAALAHVLNAQPCAPPRRAASWTCWQANLAAGQCFFQKTVTAEVLLIRKVGIAHVPPQIATDRIHAGNVRTTRSSQGTKITNTKIITKSHVPLRTPSPPGAWDAE